MNIKEFFEKYIKAGYVDPANKKAFQDFISLLRGEGYLNKRCKDLKASKYSVEQFLLTESRCEVRSGAEERFKKEILSWIKDIELYTWKNAIQESRLYPEIFEKALKSSSVWNSSSNQLSKKYSKYGLFKKNAIKKIVDAANSLKNIDNVFFIQWVGPFYSVADCRKWEKKYSISDYEYNFYFGKGMVRNCSRERYYIGKSEQRNVSNRVKDPTDPITKDFQKKDDIELWIGRFSKRTYRSFTEDEKNSNHEYVENAEWALVHGFLCQNPELEKYLKNDRKKTKPKEYCCVVNQWHNKKDMRRVLRRSDFVKLMPGLILHYCNEENVRIEDF